MPQLSAPFFRLPVHIDANRLAEEVRSLPDSCWVPDRLLRATQPSDYRSLGVVTHRGGENDLQWGPMAPSPVLARLPYVRDILSWFEAPIAEVRLRELGPGANVYPHFDNHYALFPRMRFHVPVWSNEDVWFGCDGVEVRMRAGELWLFDRLRDHWVRNESSAHARMHLIIDTLSSEALRAKLERAEAIAESGPPARRGQVPPLEPVAGALSFVTDEATVMTAAGVEAAFDRAARLSGHELPREECDAVVAQWREKENVPGELVELASRWLKRVREGRAEGSLAGNARAWMEAVLSSGALPVEALQIPFEQAEKLALRDVVTGVVNRDGRIELRSAAGEPLYPTPRDTAVLLAIARQASWTDIVSSDEEREEVARFLGDLGVVVGYDVALPTTHRAAGTATTDDAGFEEVTLELKPGIHRRAEAVAAAMSTATRVRLPRPVPFLVAPGLGVAIWFEGNGGLSWCDDYMLSILAACGSTTNVGELATEVDIEVDEGLYMTLGMLMAVEAIDVETVESDAEARQQSMPRQATILPRLLAPSPLHIEILGNRGFSAVVIDQPSGDPSFAHVVRLARRASLVPWVKLRNASHEMALSAARDGVRNFIVPHVRSAAELSRLLEIDSSHQYRWVAVIEDFEGLAALSEIAALRPVEGLMLGPSDFARACMVAELDPQPQLAEARRQLDVVARMHGKWWGSAASSAREVAELVGEGARFVVHGSDTEAFDRAMQALAANLERENVEL